MKKQEALDRHNKRVRNKAKDGGISRGNVANVAKEVFGLVRDYGRMRISLFAMMMGHRMNNDK